MKCSYCGAELQDDDLICPICGTELQIVPDYNPLEDALERQIRGAVNKTLEQTTSEQGHRRQSTDRLHQDTEQMRMEERERRRQRALRKRLLEKKRRKRLLLAGGVAFAILVILGIIGYQNSYSGRVRKGYKLLAENRYEESIACFKGAVKKNNAKSDAYQGIVAVYLAEGKLEEGEQVYLSAIEAQPENLELYQAVIGFYIDTKQEQEIAYLLKKCSVSKVLEALKDYQVEVPQFGLDESKTYDEVQALELTSKEKKIYYTTDGSTPNKSSTLYTEPIKIGEGVTVVKAIAVNEEGIPSVTVTKNYTVVFPIADAPSVTPSTGQYEEAKKIKVVVPDNYEAYYTMDGSSPIPDSIGTKKYSEEIDMPEGNTIFKVVLVDSNGRISDETIRNYELVLDEEEDE